MTTTSPRKAPTKLPEVVRHVLVAIVRAMSAPPAPQLPRGVTYYASGVGHGVRGYINAPGWSADVTSALWRGDIAEARRVLGSFGRVSIAPFADPHTAQTLAVALDAAFAVVEEHAAALERDAPVDLLMELVEEADRSVADDFAEVTSGDEYPHE